MAVKKKYTDALPVQLTPEWRARVKAVADHEQIQDSMAAVIRDCIEAALPNFELGLGLLDLDALDDDELARLGVQREPEATPEDRSAGCFGAVSQPR